MELHDLVQHLNVEQIDKYLFRGVTPDTDGWRKRVYGGQVLAQAINSALRTVESDRRVHSLHAYFLRPGDPTLPIIYDVDPIRDGNSFTTRRVVAIQKGKAIFNSSMSFQVIEKGMEHQFDMPEIKGPDELISDEEYIIELAKSHPKLVTPAMKKVQPIEIRRLLHIDPISPDKYPPVTGLWMRSKESLGDNPITHQTMLAYLSDYYFMGTALLPHGISFYNRKFQGASLDHVLYFHEQLRADEWLYYHMDSPVAAGGRGLNRGSIYSKDGRLVASSFQEGLMRLHP
ncbi:MAG: acyl-CoA thioesterase II [Gammaproteobacteria bacterium]|nr:MAG: acyl-CoA thioesterase II [Gammaproteobacteria bacterium]